MGNWNITIRGVGAHNNKGIPDDADRLAAEFVEKLKSKGHLIVAASVTAGGECDITDGAKYLAERERIDKG